MPTEQEILSNFLTERTSFENSISLSQFTALFPKQTPNNLIQKIYNHLAKKTEKRYEKVESNIEAYLKQKEASNTLTQQQIEELELTKENENVDKIIDKFDIISKLLDYEIEKKQLEYEKELQKINQRNIDLEDIIIPTNPDYPEDLEEPLDSLIEILKELQK